VSDEQKIVISSNEEKNFDKQIRPNLFDDFIGQNEIVESLKTYITAAKQREDALDHILLYGPPGLGKTTLSNIISTELDRGFLSTSGPVISIPGDLSGMLTNLQDRDVFFIDEIHRVNTTVEEYLYSAMEDYKIDILIDSGPNARTVRIDLEPFTLVGATTRLGNISTPMRDRFGAIFRLDFYKKEEIFEILKRTASILKIKINDEALIEIAGRSRGTPRIANRVLRRVRDFAQVKNLKEVRLDDAKSFLNSIGIDKNGLENMDRKILKNLIVNYDGGPTGGKSLAISINEDIQTIEDVYEPYLIKKGFIERTSRGRVATDRAYRLFGMNKARNKEQT
jgi:Holliday junction DNA helicase RuvB